MKYIFSTLLLSMFLVLTNSIGQVPQSNKVDDKHLIEQTIHKYFNGWMTGDTTLLGQAMHSSCYLKFIRDGKVATISRHEYLSRFEPHKKRDGVAGRIIEIDVTRSAAAATCKIERPDRLFTDYFNLLKVGDQWYIVDKISTSIQK